MSTVNTDQSSLFHKIPNDCLNSILKFANSIDDVFNLSFSCKSLYQIITKCNDFWYQQYKIQCISFKKNAIDEFDATISYQFKVLSDKKNYSREERIRCLLEKEFTLKSFKFFTSDIQQFIPVNKFRSILIHKEKSGESAISLINHKLDNRNKPNTPPLTSFHSRR